MKCRNFEQILVELACERLLEASVRQQALAHAESCQACAQRLAAERQLTARILEFSRATEDLRAPARVRRQLRAAVAERRAAQAASVGFSEPAVAPAAPVVSVVQAASFPRTGWPRRALAAAAVLALFVTAALWWRSSTGPVPDEMAIRDQVPLSERQPDSKPPDSGGIEAPAVTPPSPSIAAAAARSSPKAPVRSRASRRGRVAEPEAGRTETASDFVPLTPAVDEKAIENGMIVRLEVSRSKLIAMGFPLSVEGDQETVNAEVMMGDNGVAYAIRVVR